MDPAAAGSGWALDAVATSRGPMLYASLVNVAGAVYHFGGIGAATPSGVLDECAVLCAGGGRFEPLPLADAHLLQRVSQRGFVAHGSLVLIVGCAGRGRESLIAVDVKARTVASMVPGFDFWNCCAAGVLDGADGEPVLVAFGGGDSINTTNGTWAMELSLPRDRWAWRSLDAAGPSARLYHLGAAVRRRYLYVFGGAPDRRNTELGDPVFDDLWRFDAHTAEWSLLEPPGRRPSKRGSAAFHFHDPYLYLYGGFDGAPVADFWRYDVDGDYWEGLPLPADVVAAAGVWGCASALLGDTLLLAGGVRSELSVDDSLQLSRATASAALHDRRQSLRCLLRRHVARHHAAFGHPDAAAAVAALCPQRETGRPDGQSAPPP